MDCTDRHARLPSAAIAVSACSQLTPYPRQTLTESLSAVTAAGSVWAPLQVGKFSPGLRRHVCWASGHVPPYGLRKVTGGALAALTKPSEGVHFSMEKPPSRLRQPERDKRIATAHGEDSNIPA